MIAKVFFALCLQAVILQTISAQNCGCRQSSSSSSSSCSNANSNSYYGFSKTSTASSGGPLTVTCYGPLSTNGVSVLAELGMEGQVQVTGSLPFLSAVALEGTLPTTGSASVNYGCGDGNIVILQESGNPSGSNAASTSGLTLQQLGGFSTNDGYVSRLVQYKSKQMRSWRTDDDFRISHGFSKTSTASSGGPLTVTCYGPLSTNGVSVLAELGMEGQVQVTGSLPFLNAVALEGTLPTTGSASVNYGCGDGNNVILQESGNPSGSNAASTSGLTLQQLGGCGCRNY